jgi:hypothetical protein
VKRLSCHVSCLGVIVLLVSGHLKMIGGPGGVSQKAHSSTVSFLPPIEEMQNFGLRRTCLASLSFFVDTAISVIGTGAAFEAFQLFNSAFQLSFTPTTRVKLTNALYF